MEIDYSDWIKQQEVEANDPQQDQQDSIDISNKIVSALDAKLSEYNDSNPERRLTLSQLKNVYRNGARVICEDCHPGKTNNQWGLARVNMFIFAEKPIEKIEKEEELKEAVLEEECFADFKDLDISLDWIPSDEMFELADEDVQKYDLNFSYDTVDDLYLDNPLSSSSYFDLD